MEEESKHLKKKSKFKFAFSKILIIIESIIVGYLTYEGITIAKMCINNTFSGSLPWIATMVSCAWAAYGTSAAFYYNKSKAENTVGGITYESTINKNIDCE